MYTYIKYTCIAGYNWETVFKLQKNLIKSMEEIEITITFLIHPWS